MNALAGGVQSSVAEEWSDSGLLEQNDNSVLPQLRGAALEALITSSTPVALERAWITRVLPLPDGESAVIGRQKTQASPTKTTAYVSSQTFLDTVFKCKRTEFLERALWRLENRLPGQSAMKRVSPPQVMVLMASLASLALAAMIIDPGYLAMFMSLAAGVFFSGLVALRLLCLVNDTVQEVRPQQALPDQDLPVYSILVPLFRETSVLPQLLSALQNIDYPVSRLDIKLILEESDLEMRNAVTAKRLPSWYDIIVVPAGKPQTKPRALNYALAFARGECLTIYDAEDIPEPGQLRHAAETFAAQPMLACLQAKLAFFNANENWLTRQFAAEYASLFNVILPGLAAQALPLPLGGTSNHFRIGALLDSGAWDPFNVTEDAELGFRLARRGYKVATLNSTTWEEANTRFGNWQRQRRRWLKGFLQTWLVQMRHPKKLWQELHWDGFLAFQAMSLGVFLTGLLHPIFLATTIWYFASGRAALQLESTLLSWVVGLSLCILLTGYATAFVMAQIGLKRQGMNWWWLTLLTIPLYWLLMMPAAWGALWDFLVRPHHWHKTEHGLSRFNAKQASAETASATRPSSP